MWTHQRPYKRSRLTKKSIHYHGTAGLYRALNIGNLVGFIGSGVTVAYGRPTWQELVESVYQYVKKYYKGNEEGKEKDKGNSKDEEIIYSFSKWVGFDPSKPAENAAFGLGELWDTLEAFHDQKSNDPASDGERLKITLEMCENLARAMDHYARRHGKICYHAAGLRHHICSQIWGKDKEEKTIAHDPVSQIYQKLGIRRFLTVNYDIEIERFLRQRAGFSTNPVDAKDLEKLLDDSMELMLGTFNPRPTDNEIPGNHPLFQDQPNHLTSRDNLGRSVETVRLVEAALGDLIAFAFFPRPHDAQVFHLHGRLDDPENLLVTEGDYQRVYLRSGPGQRTFEEALDTLFLGNDVLFIGLGMNEADLLRPLRQFVVTDRLADVEARRIFALLPYFGEQNAVHRALDLKIRYGIQTLFFGEGMNWELREILQIVVRWLHGHSDADASEDEFKNLKVVVSEKINSIRTIFQKCANVDDVPVQYKASYVDGDSIFCEKYYNKLIGTAKKNGSKKFYRALVAPFDDSLNDEILSSYEIVGDIFEGKFSDQKEDILAASRRAQTKKRFRMTIGDLVTRGLCDEIGKIAHGWRSWWKDWLVEPRLRKSAYAYLPESDLMGPHETAIRHRPHYEQGRQNKRSSLMDRAIELMPPFKSLTRRRILRLSSERGGGKGFFFNELQTFGNYKRLVPDEKRSHYKGAYFAHTSYSLEFSSVVASLVRFIASHIGTEEDLERVNSPTVEQDRETLDAREFFRRHPEWLMELGTEKSLWPDGETPNTLSRLHKVLKRLQAAEGPRLFICLSGLERLCDKKGNAYSAAHRAFFRLLTAPEFKTLPIDLVLISGDPDHPIRYLSKGSDDSPQQWHRLPKLPLEDRHWLMRKDKNGNLLERYVSREDINSAPILTRHLEGSVALDNWVSLCSKIRFDSPLEPSASKTAEKKLWIERLEHAAGRSPSFEIISEIFDTYRTFDLTHTDGDTSALKKKEMNCDIRDLILHHLSFFSLPIEAQALLTCPEINRLLAKWQREESAEANPNVDQRSDGKPTAPWEFNTENALRSLLYNLKYLYERGLIILVHSARATTNETPSPATAPFEMPFSDQRHFRFALHGQMRQYLARQMRFALPDRGERNYYGVSLYTVQPRDLPTPSEVHFRRVYRIVEELLYSVRRALRPLYNDETDENKRPSPEELHAMTQRLRAAYSIMRESFSIGSLSRLKRFEGNQDDPGEPYEIYRGLLGALISAAAGMREKSEELKKISNRSHYRFDEAFYRQEVLWLNNERGLTAYVQGRLYDAIPLFNQALRIARSVTDGGDEEDGFRATERRIMLNLGIAEIERGNIRLARQMLEHLALRDLRTKKSTQSTTKELAEGYLGLCDHLSGHLARAETRYKNVLRDAERLESMRTLSIFHRHYADMLRLLKRNDEAQNHLRLAKLAAAKDEQKDVLQYALIAQARLYRDVGDREALREASRLLDEAERYATELGLIKLEVEALKARSTIILAQGETEQAGRLAARSAGLANRHGMELHKISAAIIHGRILLERGQIELATSVLKECSSEADRRGYQLAAIFADRLLRMHIQAQTTDELGTLWSKSKGTA